MGCPNGMKIHAIGFTYGYKIQPLRGCPKKQTRTIKWFSNNNRG